MGGVIITAISSILIVTFSQLDMINSSATFNINTYTEGNGLLVSLYSECIQSRVETPQGYSKEKAEAILAEYSDDESNTDSYDTPNVIVIMNESFSDFSFLESDITYEDPLPHIHALSGEDNCKTGWMPVSVYGGMTCNTEFEFLTGASLAFLPYGAIPYMQYMDDDYYSLAKDFASEGYVSEAIHPYYKAEWRRSQNYVFLGFENFISGERFSSGFDYEKNKKSDNIATMYGINFGDDLEYIRDYISDAECYRKIKETMTKENDNSNASFIFSVTIQNHGGYRTDDFDAYEYLSGDEYDPINEYLTLSSESDKAFYDLICELEDYPQKTVVVMFGDHQPSVEAASVLKNGDEAENDIYRQTAEDYIVPYILWANYDIDWQINDICSPNYLAAVVKENIGMPLSSWDKLRLDAYEEYPALTQNFAVSSEGEFVSADAPLESSVIYDYQLVQYEMMFD